MWLLTQQNFKLKIAIFDETFQFDINYFESKKFHND